MEYLAEVAALLVLVVSGVILELLRRLRKANGTILDHLRDEVLETLREVIGEEIRRQDDRIQKRLERASPGQHEDTAGTLRVPGRPMRR